MCVLCRQAKRAYDNARYRATVAAVPRRARCGTVGGYRRHRRNNEPPCGDCRAAKRRESREYRERRGAKEYLPVQCGTWAGYHKHWRDGTDACEECMEAMRHTTRNTHKTRRYWFKLWTTHGCLCALCLNRMSLESPGVHVDHVIPRSRGGSDDLPNLQAVHRRCNLVKRNHSNDWAILTLRQDGDSAQRVAA